MHEEIHAFLTPHFVWAVRLEKPAADDEFFSQLIARHRPQLVEKRGELPVGLWKRLDLRLQTLVEQVFDHFEQRRVIRL